MTTGGRKGSGRNAACRGSFSLSLLGLRRRELVRSLVSSVGCSSDRRGVSRERSSGVAFLADLLHLLRDDNNDQVLRDVIVTQLVEVRRSAEETKKGTLGTSGELGQADAQALVRPCSSPICEEIRRGAAQLPRTSPAANQTSHFLKNVTDWKYPNFPGFAPISAFFAGKLAKSRAVSRDVQKRWGLSHQRRCQQ